MSKLQILHIGKYYDPFKGGIESFLQDLLESKTTRERCDSWVLAHHHETQKPTETETINGITVTRVKLWKQLVFAPICPGFFNALKQILRQQQPDIIHIHMPNVSAFACLLSRDAKQRPWVIHWHADVLGTTPDWRVKLLYPVYRLFERALLKRAATIICTSPPYLETSTALAGFKHKCTVVPLGIRDLSEDEHKSLEKRLAPRRSGGINAIKPEPSNSLESTEDTTNRKLKLLCIGRLVYYKGHSHLIDTIKDLPDVELKLVGDGEMKNMIRKQITKLNLSDRVTLSGQLSNSELNRAIYRCDILCLLSTERTEAFGITILEAARLSKPSIVSDIDGSGMTWVVQHDKTGLVVPKLDHHALEAALIRIVKQPEKLEKLGVRARARFETHFSIDRAALSLNMLYENTLA
jgi:glycosyltransferase involved in cell wall biosynthesis